MFIYKRIVYDDKHHLFLYKAKKQHFNIAHTNKFCVNISNHQEKYITT